MSYKIIPSINDAEFFDINFDEHLGRGATGQVFKAQIGTHQYAVKINHDKTNFNHEKIKFMVDNHPESIFIKHNSKEYPLYSWPISIIYELDGEPIGFVMPLIDEKKSKTLDFFYDYTLSKRLNSKESIALSFKIKILQNLCSSISKLHKQGVLLIDLKPQNMRVFEGTNIVTLLDCDSFKITNNGDNINFAGEMVSPGYISPELFKANLSPSSMSIDQDLYALSVIIFQVLNKGIHPFQGVLVDDNFLANTDDEKSAAGLYPYGLQQCVMIKPKKESIHDTFLPITRNLFDRAFIHRQQRPSAEEWTEHLGSILRDKLLVRCKTFPNEIDHMHFKDMQCPECARNSVITNDEKIIYDKNSNNNKNSISRLESFKDVQHIYGIADYKDLNKSSGITTIFYLLAFLIIVFLSVFYFLSSDDSQFSMGRLHNNNYKSYNNSNDRSNRTNYSQSDERLQDEITDGYPFGSKIHMNGGNNYRKSYNGFILNIKPQKEDILVLNENYEDVLPIYLSKSGDGDIDAMHNLGLMYIKGLGVKRNLVKGINYLEISHKERSWDADSAALEKARKQLQRSHKN